MKTKLHSFLPVLVLLTFTIGEANVTRAQGTAFTFQGRLNDTANPANGFYDLRFVIFDSTNIPGSIIAGPITNLSIAVSNGLFTTTLDFGASNFDGNPRWLEIGVQKSGGGFTTLSPRQALTPAPYAIFAQNVGSGVPRTNQVWLIGGNSGTTDNFIGTTDNTTFNVLVNNIRAVRYRLDTDTGGVWTNAPNIIGGSSINFVSTGVVGATIGGGGGNDSSAAGFASPNEVTGDFGTVGGGVDNLANFEATVAGGSENSASGFYTTATGGHLNGASANYATVGGGNQNTASGLQATVAGGYNSTASGADSMVCGGYHNSANGDYSTVGGGNQNIANGDYSFAADNYAHAQHNGTFVWSDASSAAPFSSTTANQFRVRSTGGAAFATAIDVNGTVTAGVHVLSGDTAWSSISDKNAKKNFRPINGESVLEKLAAIPIEQWNYKWEEDTTTPHIGPMAQDFKGAFYPGRDDKSISTLEFDGVELAAIQGLNLKLKEKDADIQKLKAMNESLAERLAALEAAVKTMVR